MSIKVKKLSTGYFTWNDISRMMYIKLAQPLGQIKESLVEGLMKMHGDPLVQSIKYEFPNVYSKILKNASAFDEKDERIVCDIGSYLNTVSDTLHNGEPAIFLHMATNTSVLKPLSTNIGIMNKPKNTKLCSLHSTAHCAVCHIKRKVTKNLKSLKGKMKCIQRQKIGNTLFHKVARERECKHCRFYSCEAGKNGNVSGTILSHKNHTNICTQHLFQTKRKRDTSFNSFVKKMIKIKSRLSKNKEKGIQLIVVMPPDEQFNTLTHSCSVKKMKLQGGKKILTSSTGKKYTIIGNKLNNTNLVEYQISDIQNVLFLLSS